MSRKLGLKRTFILILVTVLSVLDSVPRIMCHKSPADIADLFPNKIAGFNVNKHRHFAVALALHLLPKIIYKKVEKKYKRKIKKNKKMRKKYRTIVPVSIVPPLAYLMAFNREKHSEYYIVGADDTVEPNDIHIPSKYSIN